MSAGGTLGHGDPLRQVNAVMARADVGDETGHRDRHGMGGAEQLDLVHRGQPARLGLQQVEGR